MAADKMIRQLLTLLALLACGLFLSDANALDADKVLDASQIDKAPVSLTQYFAVLDDPSTTLTLEDVHTTDLAKRFIGVPPTSQALAYGPNHIPHWFRFRVSNPGDQSIERLLELEFPRISQVHFYQPTSDGSYRVVLTGAAEPFATRPYPNRNFVFPITVPAQSVQTYFLRLQSNSDLLVPAQVWVPSAFHVHERRDYGFLAWYFGIATAMLIFNLLIFASLRDSIYFLYVVFAATTIVTFATFFGLAHEFLWPAAGWWAEKAMSVTAVFQASAFVVFTRRMLNTPTTIPRLDRPLVVLVFLANLMLAGDLASLPAAFALGQLCLLAIYLYIFWCALYCVFKRQRNAYFFAIAFTVYLVGVNMYTMMSMGILPHSTITANGGMVGSGLEMLLLAFALADRYNVLRKEKARAQVDALQAQAATLQAQNEKMTSLTQLVTNVAHEINTPIGAVKSSGQNIAAALDEVLQSMPKLFVILDDLRRGLFAQLLSQAKAPTGSLTTREERAIKNQVAKQLEAAGIADTDHKARILVKLRAQSAPLVYLPLLQHPECDFILDTADTIAVIINGTKSINTAVDRVSKIVTTLKSFAQVGTVGEMIDADLEEGIESVLAIYSNQIKQDTKLVRHYEAVPPLRCMPDDLKQVWTHLIHNALQAIPQRRGSYAARLAAHAKLDYKGTLTISLKQQGTEAVVSV